jgi:hypothetical protein
VIQPVTFAEREAIGGQEMTTYFNIRRAAICVAVDVYVEMVLIQMIVLLLSLFLLLVVVLL